MILYEIGEFEVTGDKLLACDPCYIKNGAKPWYNVLIENVLPGTYVVEVLTFDNEETGGWGDRNAKLIIRHIDYNTEQYFPTMKITGGREGYVGVDSGKALFIDKKHYDDYMKMNKKETEDFYTQCYVATAITNPGAGIVSGIPVSRSGYGDGCYDVFVERNKEGKVVAASIEFMQEEEI